MSDFKTIFRCFAVTYVSGTLLAAGVGILIPIRDLSWGESAVAYSLLAGKFGFWPTLFYACLCVVWIVNGQIDEPRFRFVEYLKGGVVIAFPVLAVSVYFRLPGFLSLIPLLLLPGFLGIAELQRCRRTFVSEAEGPTA